MKDQVRITLSVAGNGPVACKEYCHRVRIAQRLAVDRAYAWTKEIAQVPRLRPIEQRSATTLTLSCSTEVVRTEIGLAGLHTWLAIFQFEMIRAGLLIVGNVSNSTAEQDSIESCLLSQCGTGTILLPRIGCASSYLKLIRYQRLAVAETETASNGLLLVDGSGQFFLNYLEPAIFPAGRKAGPFIAELRGHRNRVSQLCRLGEWNRNVISTYWPAAYHNYFCRQSALAPRLRASKLDTPDDFAPFLPKR